MPRPATPSSSADGLALLRGQPIFGELGEASLRRLLAYAKTRRARAGTVIFSKGDPGTALFAIRSGTVKITVPARDGREAVFNLLGPGDLFGEIALLDGRSRTADAVALSDCDLMLIERRDFLAFVESDHKVALRLIELLCTRLRWASEHFEEVVLLSLPTRLARTLLRLMAPAGDADDHRRIKITQRELSQLLGATRESVNRQLREWADLGLIALTRGAIVIRSPEKLARASESAAETSRV